MGSHHHTTTDETKTPKALRFALGVLAMCAIGSIIGMALLWPGDNDIAETIGQRNAEETTGVIIAIEEQPCPELPPGYEPAPGQPAPDRCGLVTVKLDDGKTTVTNLPTGNGAPTVHVDDHVVLLHLSGDMANEYSYHIIDHDRSTQLWILGAAFALTIIAFGRIKGFTALLGLGVTFGVLLLFIIPAILDGKQPLLVAIVGAAAIMLAVIYLTHGFTISTTIAVLGVMASLILTGLLSAGAVELTHLTGIADEDTTYLAMTFGVNMQGLLLAGILIGSLGVLDDVAVTQAATVSELAAANPNYQARELYRSATTIGRSHIASVVNTIILAYAGASLPLMILIAASNRPLGQVLTNQLIAEEIVRSVVGTIGLIAAVPITTALAATTIRKIGGPGSVRAELTLTTPTSSSADDNPQAGGESEQESSKQPRTKRPRSDKNEWMSMYDD